MLASYTPTATSQGRIPSPQTSGSKLGSNVSYFDPAQWLHERGKKGKTTGMGRRVTWSKNDCGPLSLHHEKQEGIQMRLYLLLFD